MPLDVGRVTHLADLMHRAEASNGTAIASNWILSTDGTKAATWRPESAGGGSVSYASNSNDVGNPSAAGASTLVSRADHVHRGVHLLTSNTSNTLYGDVNLSAGTGIALAVAAQTITIVNTGVPGPSGGGGGVTQAYEGYNTAGGSTDTPGVNNKVYAKSITIATACLITSIGGYFDSASGTSGGPNVALYTDSSGPDKVIGSGMGPLSLDIVGGFRWVEVPVGVWVTAGTYWIAVMTSDTGRAVVLKLAYDGSGSDRTAIGGAAGAWYDWSLMSTTATSANKFSIRANTIR